MTNKKKQTRKPIPRKKKYTEQQAIDVAAYLDKQISFMMETPWKQRTMKQNIQLILIREQRAYLERHYGIEREFVRGHDAGVGK